MGLRKIKNIEDSGGSWFKMSRTCGQIYTRCLNRRRALLLPKSFGEHSKVSTRDYRRTWGTTSWVPLCQPALRNYSSLWIVTLRVKPINGIQAEFGCPRIVVATRHPPTPIIRLSMPFGSRGRVNIRVTISFCSSDNPAPSSGAETRLKDIHNPAIAPQRQKRIRDTQ